ncbi:hypothetical protein SARC_02730 [Sphaeroforma arctica JP610]|uniref:RCC1-like domain-containing protein n=1 Tax=Sphaeroforma arctica JP610 TaxID=667725 RepID=A0A0L0G849_9EUKA|nr:hypothetical protein SARC_02730 [Sphaeroforma arctica JP610]KNC85069.1 hypothetical protein SARC_02730 [Sphaeroforma arctica JP610]|eukprot:XP_014158971.1 hypothetical protein SARC_02730 [Sphaeroforma arctica JP610]
MTLYTWGPNSYGQLGIKHSDDKFTPQRVEDYTADGITLLTGGGGHTCILKANGTLDVCGWNNRGQLGLGHTRDIDHLQPVCGSDLCAKWVSIACGWAHTIGLTDLGEVYAWGCNRYGQLGLGEAAKGAPTTATTVPLASSKPLHVPLQSEDDVDPVTSIAAGLRHTCVCTKSGRVYAWGSGRHGQLGLGSQTLKTGVPAHVPMPNGDCAVQVAAGQYHTLIRTASGRVYAFGSNKHGQICPDTKTECHFVYTPTLIGNLNLESSGIPLVVDCGWSHNFLMSGLKEVYAWGRNAYGQLGIGTTDASEESVSNAVLRNVEQLSCGSEHTLALLTDKTCITWGWNEHGPCGHGGTDNILSPTPLQLLSDDGIATQAECLIVGTGYGHSMAVFSIKNPVQQMRNRKQDNFE